MRLCDLLADVGQGIAPLCLLGRRSPRRTSSGGGPVASAGSAMLEAASAGCDPARWHLANTLYVPSAARTYCPVAHTRCLARLQMSTLQRVREQQQAQPQKQQQLQPPQPRPATDGVASDRCGGRCGAAEQAAASGDASRQPDPADVAALRELFGGASPEYLAHILGRLCHGDVEVRLRFFAALQCAALHRDSIAPCARMQACPAAESEVGFTDRVVLSRRCQQNRHVLGCQYRLSAIVAPHTLAQAAAHQLLECPDVARQEAAWHRSQAAAAADAVWEADRAKVQSLITTASAA